MIAISDDVLAAIMDDMRRAGQVEILPRFLTLTADAIRSKSAPDDLVTDADIGAERMLSEAFAVRLPGALIVGEEGVAADPALLDRLADAELAVIIDPVDGTWNFAKGVPLFGMIVAVVSGGETVAGIIHYPVTGDFILARPGTGAWHVAADGANSPLKAATPKPCAEMSGFLALPMFSADEQALMAPSVTRFARTTNWGCSAYEYRLIVQGAVDFSLNAGLMPWDHAAGVLIHAEAGGYAALLSGETYRPSMRSGHLLLAPDLSSWQAIRAALVEAQPT